MIALAMMLAQAATPTIASFGIGSASCARAQSPTEQDQAFAWVMGYFSGRNLSSRTNVGHTTDGQGIVAEIKLICDVEPSLALQWAADRVYMKMRQTGR